MTAGPEAATPIPPGLSRPGVPLAIRRAGPLVGSARRWASRRSTITRSVIAVLVAGAFLVVFLGPLGLAPAAPVTTMPTGAAIEAKWGVRFTQIGMSADGGMVDVRYVILDADKASALASTPQTTPLLVDEASNRVIFAVAMKAHAHDLRTGGRYYLLYRNTGGLLQPGHRVSITLGADRLEHATVLGTVQR